MLMDVSIRSRIMRSRSTQSQVAKREVLDVDVASPCRRLLGVAHDGGTSVVVFVKEGGGLLWDMKVP